MGEKDVQSGEEVHLGSMRLLQEAKEIRACCSSRVGFMQPHFMWSDPPKVGKRVMHELGLDLRSLEQIKADYEQPHLERKGTAIW